MHASIPHEAEASGALRAALKRQYRAALAMLRDAVERCPDELWTDPAPTNAFWQVAYHTLYFTHLYLQPDEASFRPWSGHPGDVQHEDGIAGPADPASTLPLVPRPYGRADVLAYADHVDACVDGVDALDLGAATSGFWWYPIGKLEHQLVNLRHVQHHVGQLADRVRAATDDGVRWVRSKPSETGA
jgi:hypothetical protein